MKKPNETCWEYLERIPSFSRKKSSLETVRMFLDRLGNPDRAFKIIHVAGTNGKGSTCAMLTSCLKEAGYQVGTFVSPHLVDIRERFLLNGEMVSWEQFDNAFEKVMAVIPQWMEEGYLHPTYFEFLFYMAMVLFQEEKIQVLVLETGMGGRYDVTNSIEDPLVSVITSISIDHTAFLGNTKEEIANHKAGIIKPGCPVVYDGCCQEVNQVIHSCAVQRKSEECAIGDIPYEFKGGSLWIPVCYMGFCEWFSVPFAAPYQARNAALAITALDKAGFKIKTETIRSGLKNTRWAARMEQILPDVYLDGGHNIDGIHQFLKAAVMIRDERKKGEGSLEGVRIRILFAVSDDKQYKEMLKEIGDVLKPDICMLSSMETYRSLSMEELKEAALEGMNDQTEIRCFSEVQEAVRELLISKEDKDLTFIVGSLYLAGEIKAVLEEKYD